MNATSNEGRFLQEQEGMEVVGQAVAEGGAYFAAEFQDRVNR
jgi:hypothetical protein